MNKFPPWKQAVLILLCTLALQIPNSKTQAFAQTAQSAASITTDWLIVPATQSSQVDGENGKDENDIDTTSAIETFENRLSPYSANALNELRRLEKQTRVLAKQIPPAVVSINGRCSGFLISPDGFVATVGHLAYPAGKTVTVMLRDGRQETATVISSNAEDDTCTIKLVNEGPWPYLEMAPRSEVQPNAWCVAFGYPFPFPKNQNAILRMGKITKLGVRRIQTDCTIMGGDSGGPLLNLKGQVIGIHAGVTTDVNKNFHTTTNLFYDTAPRAWVKQMKPSQLDRYQQNQPSPSENSIAQGTNNTPPAHDQPSYGYFGVDGVTESARVRIRTVHAGSPAEVSGIEADDVILEVNGKTLDSFSDFLTVINSHQPGDELNTRINRFGQLLSINVQLGEPK